MSFWTGFRVERDVASGGAAPIAVALVRKTAPRPARDPIAVALDRENGPGGMGSSTLPAPNCARDSAGAVGRARGPRYQFQKV
jgi:hypothetical protein